MSNKTSNMSENDWMRNNSVHCAVLDNDVHCCKEYVTEDNVNEVNAKNETALHLAAKGKRTYGEIFEVLIDLGANINASNIWGQTPLHYAAIAKSVQNLNILLQIPCVDVNLADVNGYNALHCFIDAGHDGTQTFEDEADECPDWREGMHVLLGRGTNVNSQTKFGHSILHLASDRKDNSEILSYILHHVPDINMTLKNKMNENFLHTYMLSEIFEEIIVLLDDITERHGPALAELLNQRDVYGCTPWYLMLNDFNASVEAVEKLLSYGISVNETDNLGNTILHRIVSSSGSIAFCDVLETLIKGGADVNARNMFGQSVVSVLYLARVLDIFLHYKADSERADRWGHSPLVSIMKHRPIPDILRKLIEEGKVDVNIPDVYGCTPLHLAAYNNNGEQVELLLEFKANTNATDKLGDTPLQTAKRHYNLSCQEILHAKENDVEIIYTRSKTFEDILLNLPKMIRYSDMKSLRQIHETFGLSDDLDGLFDHLMTEYYVKRPDHAYEFGTLVDEVNLLVKRVCKHIGRYDSRFEMTEYPTGSVAEGTKVGRPDEFDFVVSFNKLNKVCEITSECLDTGYACLKFKNCPVLDTYLPFSDMEGYFIAHPFLQYLFRYIKRALNEHSLWKTGNLFYNFENHVHVHFGKPVFTFSVYWTGAVYKQLKISIDIVPVVYVPGWWPSDVHSNSLYLMNENIKAAGCLLMLQPSMDHFQAGYRHTMKDNISNTCNTDTGKDGAIRERMLRISAAPAEICLIKSLPPNFRDAYALAKILKSDRICSEIEIDELQVQLYSLKSAFESNKSHPTFKPSHVVKSYMLKNSIFYVFEEIKSGKTRDKHLSVQEITAMAYKYLLKPATAHFMKPYFLPYSDVFEFKGKKDISVYKEFIAKSQLILSIKMILGILKHPFYDLCQLSHY